MSTAPEPPTTVVPEPRRGWRRYRPRGRGAVIGAAVLALLVVAGVASALLLGGDGPGRGDRGGPGRGPDIGLRGDVGDLDDLVGPGRRGDGPGRGGPERGLGDDLLLAGTVVATTEGSLVVAPDGAQQRTVRTDDDTRVRGGDNSALGDLAPGERVVVRVDGTGDAATAVSVLVPQARVTGTVTALAADRATVTGVDGLTVVADVSGLSRKPAVGDLVVLTGAAADGTTLRADGIRVLPRSS
jgi:hypothetical protein